jgi:hypothetical protein
MGIQKRDALQKASDQMVWKPFPMVCQPLPWSIHSWTDEEGQDVHDVIRGGYINRMPGNSNLLIHNNKGSIPSDMVLDALNRLQNTGYKVNTFVLDIQKELMSKSWVIDSFRTYDSVSYQDEYKPIVDSEHQIS